MPFVLLMAAIVLLVAGVRGTHKDLFELLKGDFTGEQNFFYWVVSILAVGAIGYVPNLKPLSNAFIVLIILVMFLSNRGFFNAFVQELNRTRQPAPSDAAMRFTTGGTSSDPSYSPGRTYGIGEGGSVLGSVDWPLKGIFGFDERE